MTHAELSTAVAKEIDRLQKKADTSSDFQRTDALRRIEELDQELIGYIEEDQKNVRDKNLKERIESVSSPEEYEQIEEEYNLERGSIGSHLRRVSQEEDLEQYGVFGKIGDWFNSLTKSNYYRVPESELESSTGGGKMPEGYNFAQTQPTQQLGAMGAPGGYQPPPNYKLYHDAYYENGGDVVKKATFQPRLPLNIDVPEVELSPRVPKPYKDIMVGNKTLQEALAEGKDLKDFSGIGKAFKAFEEEYGIPYKDAFSMEYEYGGDIPQYRFGFPPSNPFNIWSSLINRPEPRPASHTYYGQMYGGDPYGIGMNYGMFAPPRPPGYTMGGNLPEYGFWGNLGDALKRGWESGRGRNDALSQAMATNVAPMDIRNQQMNTISQQNTNIEQQPVSGFKNLSTDLEQLYTYGGKLPKHAIDLSAVGPALQGFGEKAGDWLGSDTGQGVMEGLGQGLKWFGEAAPIRANKAALAQPSSWMSPFRNFMDPRALSSMQAGIDKSREAEAALDYNVYYSPESKLRQNELNYQKALEATADATGPTKFALQQNAANEKAERDALIIEEAQEKTRQGNWARLGQKAGLLAQNARLPFMVAQMQRQIGEGDRQADKLAFNWNAMIEARRDALRKGIAEGRGKLAGGIFNDIVKKRALDKLFGGTGDSDYGEISSDYSEISPDYEGTYGDYPDEGY